jgi:general secretion pathway protein G
MKRALLPITLTLTLIAAVAFGGLYLASGKNACRWKPKQAREATLKQELFAMRVAIDTYTLDKDRPPQSLQDLVVGHYIRELPTDPFTCRKDWVAEIGSMELSPELTAWGLYDIHSSSGQVGTNGRAYNTW